MAAHGKLEEFPGSGWSSWAERLDFFFEANDVVQPGKKKALLLTLCGAATYETVRALVAPRSPAEVEYAELMAVLREHFDPRPSELYSRSQFQRRNQQPGESVSEYVAALKKLAVHCNFGLTSTIAATARTTGITATAVASGDTAATTESTDSTGSQAPTPMATEVPNPTQLPLEVMLRDRLVCGIRDEHLQQRFFAEPKLTLQKAYDMAVRLESACQQQKELRAQRTDINAVKNSAVSASRTKSSRAQTKEQPDWLEPCYRCQEQHSPQSCRFKSARCRVCQKIGHIAKACRSKQRPKATHNVEQEQRSESISKTSTEIYELNSIGSSPTVQKFMLKLKVEDKVMEFEVDSGAACSLISEVTYHRMWPARPPKLDENEEICLRTWSGEGLSIMGTANVRVRHKSKDYVLPLVVTKGAGASLLGRNWFAALKIRLYGLNQVKTSDSLDGILAAHEAVFNVDITGHNGPPVKLELRENATPHFLKARPVPFAVRSAVEAELQMLQTQGIIAPVQHSDWATPVVVVRKKDGSIRLCGDYRSTINKEAKPAIYPMPTVSEILTNLQGGTIFSTLDLTQAYQQLWLSEETAQMLTINTIKGLYKVKRMPFGISAAPAIFQRFMETVLSGIPGIGIYLDDIIISGTNATQHLERLDQVLNRLEKSGLRLKRTKCQFGVSQVQYLGFKIDASGVHPMEDKLKAIREMPMPSNKMELQSFLGLLAFYDRFLPNRASKAKDLYRLLEKDVKWKWEDQHSQAVLQLKRDITDTTRLTHFDERKQLVVSCDASPYGVGAVLSKSNDDGTEDPIIFTSRTLGKAERNYSQLDREGLAIMFAMDRFHQYIAGRHVTVTTDHQPLLGILGANSPVPAVLSPRMRRWCVKLSAYDYDLVYRPGKDNQNADALSRLPLPETEDEPRPPGDVLMLEAFTEPPMTAQDIATKTQADTTLSRVYQAVQEGTLKMLQGEEFTPYKTKAEGLSSHRGCVIWGSRVVLPPTLRSQALELIHAGHRGIVAMKSCARSYVWWPGIDKEVELEVAKCLICQEHQRTTKKTKSPIWERPSVPWDTIHLDFAGPIGGQVMLVIVDAYTKWLEVRSVRNMSSESVIRELRNVFATFGVPRKVVTDNGTAFVSEESSMFYRKNGIIHITSAPYHPATNGQAERMVQELKRALAKGGKEELQCILARFLFKQHTTVHMSTGKTPAVMLFGRELPSLITRLVPPMDQRSPPGNKDQKEPFCRDQPVWVRKFPSSHTWMPGKVVSRVGPRSWLIDTTSGQVRRHQNHIRWRVISNSTSDSTDTAHSPVWDMTNSDTDVASDAGEVRDRSPETPVLPATLRASTRQRRAPERWGYDR